MAGPLLTPVPPEPAGRSLEDLTGADDVIAEAEQVIADRRRRSAAARERTPAPPAN